MSSGGRLLFVNVALRTPMTQEQFFRWAEVQDGRFEFDGEQPVAMTGGTNDHSLIVVNVISELHGRLRGTSCRVLSSEGGGVATIDRRIRYPDATVTCSPVRGSDRLIPNPVVVFEVVSGGNSRVDRFHKMREYHAVASIRHYVLIEQTSPVLVRYSRQGEEAWTATSLSIGDMLMLPPIDVEIPVADIFDGVSFGDDQDLTAT